MAFSADRLTKLKARQVKLEAMYDAYVNAVEEYQGELARVRRIRFEAVAKELKEIEAQIAQMESASSGSRIRWMRGDQ